LPDLDEVLRVADIVLSIVPPERAPAVAGDVAAAAQRTGAAPLVADLNAVSPLTMQELAALLGDNGLELVDGSISGGPPRAEGSTRIYLSGPRAPALAALPAPGIDARVVGDTVGTASAVKMCTASVYKGTIGLLAHALLTAQANGVLSHVLDDLREGYPDLVERAPVSIARAAAKSERFVAEMREIAETQRAAGLPADLFEGFAEVYAALARTPLAREAPETIDGSLSLDDVLAALAAAAGRTR
jgi:3-hydroxyisobutyrate dehydrogenase-like beta-hydroxyacid dehydrogenase